MIRFLFAILLAFWWNMTWSQTPAYLHFGVRDGLPSNLIYCGLQDPNGFLWFGTDQGLVCFDGIRFHAYGMKDGLPDQEVLSLKMDHSGRLWIGCFQQMPCYMQNGKIITYKQDTLLKHLPMTTGEIEFYEDTDGSVIIADRNGSSYRYCGNHIEKSYPTSNFFRINGILYSGQRKILECMPDNSIFPRFDFTNIIGPNNIYFPQGLKAIGHSVLASYASGLCLVEWQDTAFFLISKISEPVGQVNTDLSGHFWVCPNEGGACLFRDVSNGLKKPELFLAHERVNTLFEDNQHTIWFLTTNGIFALPESAPVIYNKSNGLVSNNIACLLSGPKNTVLEGDDDGNVTIIDKDLIKASKISTLNNNNRIRQMLLAGDDSLWICANSGIYLLYKTVVTRAKIKHNPKAIAMRNGELWFATRRSIGFIPQGTNDTIVLGDRRFTSVQADNEGYIWAGGIAGLYSNRDTFRHNMGTEFPLLNGRIISIQNAGRQRLWIATPENGLMTVRTKHGVVTSVEQINRHPALPTQNIKNIYVNPEDTSTVWLCTNRGVYGYKDNGSLIHFDTHHGLAEDDVNTILVRGDTLWAGTVGGLTRIILRSQHENALFPTHITGIHFTVQDQPADSSFIGTVNPGRVIRLAPDAVQINLDLAGLDYTSRGNIRFTCIRTEELLPVLEWTPGNFFNLLRTGFRGKTDSIEIGNGTLNFGFRLTAGKYRLLIYAINTGGVRSRQPDQLTLIMAPHWYETIWFWIGVWSIIGLGIWRFIRSRIAFRELNATASELQLQALQAQMNPHFVGNSINAIQQFFYPPDPEKASEYISLFTRLLRQTMSFSEQHFIQFGSELQYDHDYLKMVQLRFGDRFMFSITGQDTIPADTPFPAMILQPLLENATIHGLATEGVSNLQLRFAFDGNKLTAMLCDNGTGILETQRRKKTGLLTERKSKGIELLMKKAQTINRMYDIALKIDFKDLSEAGSGQTGTCVQLVYTPGAIRS